jgi:hypothetical protein
MRYCKAVELAYERGAPKISFDEWLDKEKLRC